MFFILFLITSVHAEILAQKAKPFLAAEINFEVSQKDPKLRKLLGQKDESMLCWPSSLSHRMFFLKNDHQPPYSNLKLKSDPVANVEKFVKLCGTSKSGGTSQNKKLPCIRKAFEEAGYKAETFSVGADSEQNPRAVGPDDLVTNLANDYAVILHIQWLKKNSKTQKWEAHGSHSINAYGFNYKDQDQKQGLYLQIVNPGENYGQRPIGKMYDVVRVKNLDPEIDSVKNLKLALTGPGLDRSDRVAAIRNIYVFKVQESK